MSGNEELHECPVPDSQQKFASSAKELKIVTIYFNVMHCVGKYLYTV